MISAALLTWIKSAYRLAAASLCPLQLRLKQNKCESYIVFRTDKEETNTKLELIIHTHMPPLSIGGTWDSSNTTRYPRDIIKKLSIVRLEQSSAAPTLTLHLESGVTFLGPGEEYTKKGEFCKQNSMAIRIAVPIEGDVWLLRFVGIFLVCFIAGTKTRRGGLLKFLLGWFSYQNFIQMTTGAEPLSQGPSRSLKVRLARHPHHNKQS